MIRFAMEQLMKWKGKKRRKPLIIRGARQVGKTWLMKEFARTAYAPQYQIVCAGSLLGGGSSSRHILSRWQGGVFGFVSVLLL